MQLLEGVRLLVVDDDEDSRDLNSFVLQAAGAEVVAIESANTVLNWLEQFKPHALLCDLAMPDVDGYMLMSQVKVWQSQQGCEVPALAVTAMVGQDVQQKTRCAGFKSYMAKPIEPDRLVEMVASLLHSIPKKQKPPNVSPGGWSS